MKPIVSVSIALCFLFCSCSDESFVASDLATAEKSVDKIVFDEDDDLNLEQEFDYEIDQRCSDCCAENSTTAGMKECTFQAIKEWEDEMNKYYNLLLDTLNNAAKKKIIKSQQDWERFSASELQFSHELYGNLEGTIWGIIGLGQTMEKVKSRAIELELHYGAITGDAIKG